MIASLRKWLAEHFPVTDARYRDIEPLKKLARRVGLFGFAALVGTGIAGFILLTYPYPSEAAQEWTETPTPSWTATAAQPTWTSSPSKDLPAFTPTTASTPTDTESYSPTAQAIPTQTPTLFPSPTLTPLPFVSATPEPTLTPTPTNGGKPMTCNTVSMVAIQLENGAVAVNVTLTCIAYDKANLPKGTD